MTKIQNAATSTMAGQNRCLWRGKDPEGSDTGSVEGVSMVVIVNLGWLG